VMGDKRKEKFFPITYQLSLPLILTSAVRKTLN